MVFLYSVNHEPDSGHAGRSLNLVVSYYSGKRYRLTASSVLVYLVLLVVAVVVGNLLGFVVAQIRYPQYPWLNTVFFVQILGVVPSLILWSLAGMLAGNCKREMSARKEQSESKAPVAAT